MLSTGSSSRCCLEYRPQLVVVACGVDASLFDPMSRLGVTATGFAGMAERLLGVASEVADGRLVSVQEGGYSPVYSPLCWLAFIETIGGLGRPRRSVRGLHR